MSDFDTISLDDIDADLVSSPEVRNSALEIRTLPAGKYIVEVENMELRRNPEDSEWNPGRAGANYTVKTEGGRKLFFDASWEPAQNDSGTDDRNKLYGQIELALDMYGEPIREVLAASETATFEVEINESAKVPLSLLPEDDQRYWTEVRGMGELSQVRKYIKADEEDLRNHLAANGAKLQNFVRNVKSN